MHAVIEVAGANDITLIDLGNEPGTLVNGQRVNKCKVRPGDQIQIGSTMIHLEKAEIASSGAGATAASPPPAPVIASGTMGGVGPVSNRPPAPMSNRPPPPVSN